MSLSPKDELGASSRALLDAARPALGPDAAAIARMRAKIGTAVGTTAVATGSGLATKLGVLAVVGAIATGGYLYATRDRGPSRTAIVDPARVAVVEREANVEPSLMPPPAPAIAHPAPIDEPTPAETKQVAPPPKIEQTIEKAPTRSAIDKPVDKPVAKRVTQTTNPAVETRTKAVGLAREVELVDQAMAAMRRGDTRGALVAVRTHATETKGAGQLAEDAAAIEIEALCKLHDPGVAAKLTAFDARWPQSAQRSRLSSSCP